MGDTEPSPPQDSSQLDSLTPSNDDESAVAITIKFPPAKHNQTWVFSSDDTFEHLVLTLALEFPSYDWDKSKALVERRRPGLKALYTPSQDSSLPLPALHGTTLRLLAPQTSSLTSLHQQSQTATSWQAKRALARARHARLTPAQRASTTDATYTFHALLPLAHLPDAALALALLARLRSDPGIRHVMRQHRFTVGLLTEMDPAAHTTATPAGGVARTLGLNRNRGEAIELRLRTDARDGWRDYRTIRRTLCHELAHNVHSAHDQHFWALCREIERGVERADWNKSGRTVGGGEYAPERDAEDADGEHARTIPSVSALPLASRRPPY
ncbi:WLM-domain-containing protein [Trichocladium antarcticum]|uniref:WLM-domain-containing protein n=1 Tax=Trichocladium antarcticum TaxID=1450529 RepID=A0AAN6UML0_9PEZI|nr:WLM-domain-containing protein [Trichocladium antarcticum]